MRVGVALGSNLGDRGAYLRAARASLLSFGGFEPGGALAAPIYETAPVGCAPGTRAFYNSVLEVESVLPPETLLSALLSIEAAAGRDRRDGGVNAPRPLDLDLLYAGETVQRSPRLTLPHPRMFSRRFVLAPLAAIRPALVLPGQTRSVVEILAALDDDPSEVALAAEQW